MSSYHSNNENSTSSLIKKIEKNIILHQQKMKNNFNKLRKLSEYKPNVNINVESYQKNMQNLTKNIKSEENIIKKSTLELKMLLIKKLENNIKMHKSKINNYTTSGKAGVYENEEANKKIANQLIANEMNKIKKAENNIKKVRNNLNKL